MTGDTANRQILTMADKISPEERLFKVIREGRKSPSGRVRRFFANLKAGALVRQGSEKAASTALPIKFQEIDLKVINKIFMNILVISIIFGTYYMVSKRPSAAKIADVISGIKLQAIKRRSIETFKPLYFYTDEVKKRDIFRPVVKDIEEIKVKITKPKLQELAKDLTLVGIYIGRYPEVMIEVKTEEKTYFLKQGDEIKGMKIKEILKDRVILEYQGEEIELI